MNKVQKTIAFVSVLLIFLLSLVAINEKSYLGGIVGLALAVTLLIVCFSGRQKMSPNGSGQRGLLKRKSTKIIVICIGFIIISICLFILYSYISFQRKQLIEEKTYYEQKEKERIAEQTKIKKDFQYLKKIEIVTSKIESGRYSNRAYLYVEIKNNGDRIVDALKMEVFYYEKAEYLIDKITKTMPSDEYIDISKKKKYRFELYKPPSWNPFEDTFKIKIVSCRTVHSR